MNVLRSLARNLWSTFDVRGAKQPETGSQSLQAVRQDRRVAGVLGLSRFRDGFEQFPQGLQGTLRTLQAERAYRPAEGFRQTAAALQRDGFERGALQGTSRAPVDLSGGVKAPTPQVQLESSATPAAANGFVASLDDLGSLIS